MHRGGGQPRVALGYVAGLDGIRALSIVGLLAYHHGIGAARGGMLGVSTFFTLSGFLIAGIVLEEWSTQGRLSLRRFWERRARRLLPAALVTLAGIVVVQYLWEVGSGPRFRGDVLAALGYAANWRMAASGEGYAAIFSAESPIQHFWSLAVEEQFYLAFPLLFVGAMALARGRWRIVGAAFAVGAVASFAAAWTTASAEGNSGLAYFATYTRAGEILVGVVLAFVVATGRAQLFLTGRWGTWSVRIAGAAGLVGLAWLWHSVDLDDEGFFHGITALNAVLTCLVVGACISPAPGRLAQALGAWPLRNLGKISYAVYLFHWPIFLLLDGDRTGLSSAPLLVLRVGVTLALAIVSYHLLETPFRFRLRMPRLQLAGVMAGGAAVAAGLAAFVPVQRTNVIELVDWGDTDTEPQSVVVTQAPPPTEPIRAVLVGDSVAFTMAPGLNTWNKNHPDQQVVADLFVSMGCSVAEPGVTRYFNKDCEVFPDCLTFRETLAANLRDRDYDVVIVVMGAKDLGEREVEGKWRSFGDPVYDDWFREQAGSFADVVAGEGVPVVWATMPHIRPTPQNADVDWRQFTNNEPERVDRYNEITAEVLATRPTFHRVDVGGWLRGIGGEYDREIRYDLLHYTFSGSDEVAEFTVPQILAAVGR